jgi:hydrogenase nickel incorporation protein HypA/HybF
MHEMSIAAELVERLFEIARENRLERIEKVELDVGVLRQIVPEALENAFAAAVAGTLAEGALLEQREVPARAACRACGREFPPSIDCYLCPGCGKADVELLEGQEIILKSLSGNPQDEGENR